MQRFSTNKQRAEMKWLFVACFFLLALSFAVVSGDTIRFGQSCALTGATKDLGIQMNKGLMAAFKELNDTDALRGTFIELVALDDTYEPIPTHNNTKDLIQNYNVFGLVGGVGTPTSQESIRTLDAIGNSTTPFIGAFTGAKGLLRSPFRENVVNLRSSYIDETAAMVKFLTSKQVTRISIFYQNDTFGLAGLEGLQIALAASGLEMESNGTYPRNTMDVEAGLDQVFANHTVQALVMIGAYSPLARAVQYARANYSAANTYFFTVSFVGADSYREKLQLYGQSFDKIYVTQVVPPPRDTSYDIVRQYQNALTAYDSAAQPNFVSLEGYMVGQLVIEALARVRGPITPASFLDAIYTSSIFYMGGVTVGPYFGNNTAAPCNQGLKQIFLTSIQPDGNYTLVPDFDFRWDSCLSSTSNILNAKRIKWGQTCAMTGPTADLGVEMNRGVLTAFAEANAADALRGVYLDLVTLDDKYDTVPAYTNTKDLISRHHVFGLIGNVGTPTAQQTVNAMKELGSTIPLIGAFTGAKFLRLPFTRNIINVRASYIDETASMVNWLTNNLVSRISIFYQNDAFGLAGYEGLSLALNASGLALESEGLYTRNTLDIEAGMTQVLSRNPEAIVMIGAYAPLARAVEFGRNFSSVGANAYYLTVSFVGADSFRQHLVNRGQSFKKIYVTQVVPPPRDTTEALVVRYQESLAQFYPNSQPNFVSLEGYLAGLLAVETVARMRGNLTSSNFLNSIYESQLFVIAKQKLGPYIDSAASTTLNCNQGIHKVWFTEIGADGNYTVVPGSDFSWESTCLSATSDLLRPLVFGQSAALTGPTSSLGVNMRAGILAAFNRFNRQGGLEGRPVKLLTYDDGYEPTKTAPNTKELISHGVVGLLGFTGTPTSAAAINISIGAKVPFIAPYTGASLLRNPCSKYVVNMRSSYIDEAAAMISWLVDAKYASSRNGRTFSNIAIFYQNDTFGLAGYEGVTKALNYRKMSLAAIGLYPRNTLDVENGLFNMTKSASTIDAVIMIGAYAPCAKFVKLGKAAFNPTTVYFAISFVGADAFADQLRVENIALNDISNNPTIYVSQVVPNPRDEGHPLAQEYLEEIALLTPPQQPNYIAFEGYAAGRFATRALQLISGPVNAKTLTDTIFEYPIFNMKNYQLGPFTLNTTNSRLTNSSVVSEVTVCTCNQGSHEVWMTYLTGNYSIVSLPDFQFVFDTCGVIYEVFLMQAPSEGIRGLIMALSVIGIVVVIAAAIGVVIFRNTKTLKASSPIFLLMILFGGLMLVVSPFFTLSYGESNAMGNSICMTWIWLLGLGYTLFFSPLVVKTWRVYRIFNNRVLSRVITIRDSELLLYLLAPVLIEVAILIAWTIKAQEQLMTIRVPGTVDQIMQLCSTPDGSDQPLIIAQSVFFGIIAAVGCIFAFLTRNIKYGAFKESTEILFAVYNLTFLSVILVPLHSSLTYSPVASTIIRSIGVIFLVVISVLVLFGMKFWRIITGREKMSTSSRRSITSSRYGSGFGTSGTTRSTTNTSSSGKQSSDKSSYSTTSSDEKYKKGKKNAKKEVSSSSEFSSTNEESSDAKTAPKTKGRTASSPKPASPKPAPKAQSPTPKPASPKPAPRAAHETSEETEPSSEEVKAKKPKKETQMKKIVADDSDAEAKEKPAPKKKATKFQSPGAKKSDKKTVVPDAGQDDATSGSSSSSDSE